MRRIFGKSGLPIAIALLATSCVSAVSALPVMPDSAQDWSLDAALDDLRAASCSGEETSQTKTPIKMAYTPLTDADLIEASLPDGVSLHGAWHVTSDNSNWGGISGLDYSETGALVALSDRGVLFDLPLNDGTLKQEASLSYLLNAEGKHLSGKRQKDSEGLALYKGAALISFERDHRIDLYDIETCGAAARPASVAILPDRRDGKKIDPNRGAEALAVSAAGKISFAFEQPGAQSTPLGILGASGDPVFLAARASTPLAYALVGREHATRSTGDEITADLLRSYDPLRGLRALLRVGETQISLAPPAPIDNFEGVALQPNEDGSVTAWIISDDNFQTDQRTLLFAFTIGQN